VPAPVREPGFPRATIRELKPEAVQGLAALFDAQDADVRLFAVEVLNVLTCSPARKLPPHLTVGAQATCPDDLLPLLQRARRDASLEVRQAVKRWREANQPATGNRSQ
jgi:hypothetical protein